MVYYIATISFLLLLTGFSHAASTYNRGEDEGNSYETDQQVVNGQMGSLASHGPIQLMAVPRGYLHPLLARDFKRVALTPRIGRSSDGLSSSSLIGSNSWFDDDDYYNRVIKSSFTPRVGRSVNVNAEKSSPVKTSKP